MADIVPLNADSPSLSQASATPRWGVFDQSSVLVLNPDNIISVDVGKDYRLSDYPIEKGGFESYNKVTRPTEVKVTMSRGGDQGRRANFIGTLEILAEKLDLVNVVTPEATYLNVNIERWDYVRAAQKGAGLITVEIDFLEIRQTVTATFSTPQTPSAASPVNGGTVATRPLTPDERAAVAIAAGSPLFLLGGE